MAEEDDVTLVTVPALERIAGRGQVWPLMAEKYGVTNLVPPWKSSLDGMCDALDHEGVTLPLLTRRNDEDRLVHEVYPALPYPENQLVALSHSLIARHVIDEEALAERMRQVRARLEEA
ncbi:thiocyanate hydrolase [Mycobacterium sp. TNTM28]|uniref:Thiocyanate hydrolase n=1 Tax=[Mycobacterium] fortunisiensis TaxID=2600579 RepID=A0ABS6KNI1_9MYCO|nr:thiocyanate hydrolase [[Mycobacterium] fortunisiensis]MBU9765146.1 thiocyanate hydrolase [[Mycobacterium] fortunisiensis]